jgi:hypothetical protein
MSCIFSIKPPECSVCMDSFKINCLLNHKNYAVKSNSKAELRLLLNDIMNDKERYIQWTKSQK